MEEQAGFRWLRGKIDGLFATTIRLQKRKEHNLETWALFIDSVKAFENTRTGQLSPVGPHMPLHENVHHKSRV